jgi:hypothetical protein
MVSTTTTRPKAAQHSLSTLRTSRIRSFLQLASIALLCAAVSVFLAGAQSSPAQAANCSGVTVVVDFSGLGGGVQTGCAPGDPVSGLSALQGAGFGYSFVPRQPGFICQINSAPNPCNGAPATQYWSYWHGQSGSWSYSNAGAGTSNPAPGAVEGWAFGAGQAPGINPPNPDPDPQPPAQSNPGTTNNNVSPPGSKPLPHNENPPATAGGNSGEVPTEQTPNESASASPDATNSASSSSRTEKPKSKTANNEQVTEREIANVSNSDKPRSAVLNWVAGAMLAGALIGFAAFIARQRRRST